MKKFKSLLIGAGVALINISPIFTKVIRTESCLGNCGNCGFSCVQTTIGMFIIGIGILLWKKIKAKFNKYKLKRTN